MQEIQSWKTIDGQVFLTQDEAEAHEAEIVEAEKINKFLEVSDEYAARGQRTRARNAIRDYLTWARTQG